MKHEREHASTAPWGVEDNGLTYDGEFVPWNRPTTADKQRFADWLNRSNLRMRPVGEPPSASLQYVVAADPALSAIREHVRRFPDFGDNHERNEWLGELRRMCVASDKRGGE